jgi:rootletin
VSQDDALSQSHSLTNQNHDLEDSLGRAEARLEQLQRSLGETEEGKRDTDSRLANAQTALMLQEEKIRRDERDRKQLTDRINNLERNTAGLESEKRQLTVGA